MTKVEVKQKIALVNFQFEFGNRLINNFRSLLMVIVIIKLFEVPNFLYPVIVFLYAVGCWFIGYLADRFKLPEYFQTVYYDKSGKMVKDIQDLTRKIKETKMKKVFIITLLLVSSLFSQNFYDSPSRAVMDTIGTVSYATRDFYFNPANNITGTCWNNGTAELKTVATMYSAIETADTLLIEAWGITLIKHKKAFWLRDETVPYYTDSTRIGTIAVSTDTTLKSFALDQIFSTFYEYDGVRIKYKLGGSDADSVKLWSVIRLYIPSEN